MIALVLAVVLTLAVPAAAGAATASVEPYVEPPGTDGFGSCTRYMMCPPDMVVVTAAPAENNHVVIANEGSAPADGSAQRRYRFIVTDNAGMQAGPGCAQLDFQAVACTAGAVGPVQLGDGDDSFASGFAAGDVHGGDGQDVLQHSSGRMRGGDGDDVIIGREGEGGAGDDVLTVQAGAGGSGDDVLRCFLREQPCRLDGGPGNDLLTGGDSFDRIFGRRGADVLRGGAGNDFLRGGLGADRVDCGPGRGDRALPDRRDAVRRSCERVARPG